MKRFFLKILTLITLYIFGLTNILAQTPEIPVLVNRVANAKAMFIIDDSGSMTAVMEHPEFDPTIPEVLNNNNKIPGLIFRLESGSQNPSTNHTLRPALLEYNYLYNNVLTSYRGQVTGNLYNTASLSNANQLSSVKHFGCTTSGGYCCPPVGSCNYSNVFGINNAVLYNNNNIRGSNVFQVANLAKNGGSNVTDTNGHEYLYVEAHSNLFYINNFNWGSYWPKFDNNGNQINYQTRVFSSSGGTVVFNDREIFLAAGMYRIEYLRWLFYVATPQQLENLPGATRLQIVKDVMEELILSNPNVAFGLATLNGTDFNAGVNSGYLIDQWYTPEGNAESGENPKIRAAVGSSANALISALDTIGPSGGTPLANTYIEVMRYFNGQTDNDPYCNNCQYTSPITSQCDGHFIVMLTDGIPTSESPNSFNGQWINDCVGDGSNGAATNSGCSQSICPNFLDDAACIARTHDFAPTPEFPGVQSIISYAVGLGLDFDLLNKFAEAGGTGEALRADTAEDITEALQSIITTIISTPVSGAGVALAESFGQSGRVYRPRFRADVWRGNIDVFEYVNGNLQFLFDMGDILEARNIVTSPRNIIVGFDPNHDGNTNQSIPFTKANSAILRPELFKLFIDGTESPTLLATPLADYNNLNSTDKLIDYIHGIDFQGLRKRDQDNDGQVEKLGDIVYSRPVEVGPKNGNYNKMDGYADFVAGRAAQPSILLVGANDGMLHAFDSLTGAELWAYIPAAVVKYLERLSRPQFNIAYRRAYVDGDIVVEDAYVNGSWRTLAMFGLRTGGSSYTVLDITDRSNPSLLFEVDVSANGGQSWTSPIIVPVNGPSSSSNPSDFSWHMVVGTGKEKITSGTNLITFDLGSNLPSGTVIPLDSSDPPNTRTSDITALQTDKDLSVDRIYVGTESGDMYRIHTTGLPGSWTKHKLYSGTPNQPITAAPIGVLAENPLYDPSATIGIETIELAIGVYWGTGRFDTTIDITTTGATTQSIIGMFDPVETDNDNYAHVLTNLSKASLKNQSTNQFDVTRGSGGIYTLATPQSGFYIDLDTSINLSANSFINPVGMVSEQPLNLRGALLFSTYLPNQGECSVGGYGFLQAVNFRTGGGLVVDLNIAQESPFYNGGVPDMDGDSDYDSQDLDSAFNNGIIQPFLDAHIESIDTELQNPYVMDGLLQKNDIRLHATNGGIMSSVTALGETGAPSSPSVLFNGGRIIIQPAYPVAPSNNTGIIDSSTIPPPEAIPVNIYNIPPSILSFHEDTGQ